MYTRTLTAALLTGIVATPAFAQSNVRIYGVLDTGIEHTRHSNGTNLTRMMQTGHVPSRLGFEGDEDLGGGLKARFRMEQGLAVDTGIQLQGGRAWGRDTWVGLRSNSFGEVRLGRQYSVLQQAFGRYDVDHLSPYSPMLVAQLSNLEQTSQDNIVKYITPNFGGFSGTLTAALGEGTAVAAGSAPQVAGTGTVKRGGGALLEYQGGPIAATMAYQVRGQHLAAGAADQSVFAIGGIYTIGDVELGAMYWQHRNELPNGRTPKTRIVMLGGTWQVMPNLKLIAQVAEAKDNGMAYTTGNAKARGKDTYLNFGATYDFSKRTAVYTRFGRVEDENAGFNGRPNLASVPARDATPLTANASLRAVMVGLRHRF